MRAIRLDRFGGPEVLHAVTVETPEPGPGEVLVRVEAASVNPADWKLRAGMLPRFGPPPFVLGRDFAGTVAAIGPDATGVAVGDRAGSIAVGDRVHGFSPINPLRGSHAEYVTAAVDQIAVLPAGFDPVPAAGLPLAGVTAYQPLVHVADLQPGQRVLVHAAAGGIGHLAVQIVKALGGHVIGTARAANHALLRELGADEVIDYTAVDFTEVVRDVDVVLDPISGDYGLRSLDVLRPGGVLLDVRGTGPDRETTSRAAAERGLRFVPFGYTPSGTDLAALDELVSKGALRVHVAEALPLDEAAKAHQLVESGHVAGKVVLVP
jgi:NADPH:quinone reductase-like Zn-dependent oxidoreductase